MQHPDGSGSYGGSCGGRREILEGMFHVRKHRDHAIYLRHSQDAVCHAFDAGEAEGSAGFREAGEGFDDLSDEGAVDVIDAGHFENHEMILLFEQAIDFLFEALAVGAHLQAAAQFQNGDARMVLFAVQEHGPRFLVCENAIWKR